MIEDKLIRAAQGGDRTAFAQLLALVYDLIYRFAFKWAGNRFDAEDITQQACIKLAKVISQFRFESAFTTWLYRLVVNCANDWGRAEKRHEAKGPEHSPAMAQGPPEPEHSEVCAGAGAEEASVELHQLLAQVTAMGKGFKETLLLVLAQGMTHAEAAQILGIKESTVSWRIHEIRKQLKFLDNEAGAAS